MGVEVFPSRRPNIAFNFVSRRDWEGRIENGKLKIARLEDLATEVNTRIAFACKPQLLLNSAVLDGLGALAIYLAQKKAGSKFPAIFVSISFSSSGDRQCSAKL
jgi:hypothetical protein